MNASTSITKCVILARGLGSRMRKEDAAAHLQADQSAAASAGMKAMIPIGRPFLDYVLSALADAGFRHACLVIGPEHDAIRDYYTRQVHPERIAVSFAIQAEPIGTANAVLAAADFIASDQFLVMNSDNYYPIEVLHGMQDLGQPGAILFEAASLIANSNIPEDRLRAFAACVVDPDGFLADITEKGAAADFSGNKLISMNVWRFSPDILDACRDVPLSPRGEYELPQAVRLAVKRGIKLKTAVSHAGVLDLSRRSDIAAVAERLKHVEVRL